MNQNLRKLDGPPIPMLVDGLHEPKQVEQLFADLAAHTTNLEVRDRSGKVFAPAHACEQLLRRKIPALQMRYHFDHYDWTDTVMHTPQGLRVVRCRHEPYSGESSEDQDNAGIS